MIDSEVSLESLPATAARAMIRSLSRGTTISEGVRYIHVGHRKWALAQYELLSEIHEDGHSDTKFVRGSYGAGKSHFLSLIQDHARNQRWVTCHIECKVDGVQIDRFETLYPQIATKLRVPGAEETYHPIRALLEAWVLKCLETLRISRGVVRRPFDDASRMFGLLETRLLRSNMPPDFVRATCAFAMANLAGDEATTRSVSDWLSGLKERVQIPQRYLSRPVMGKDAITVVTLRPIGKGTAIDAMRGLLWLTRAAGFSGLVLCIDEVEELAKLGSKKRQDQALQALREYVDHAGGEGGFKHLCMYLAATPEMFDGPDYFPRYDALATRIQAVGAEINWRSPIIDLDKTPLAQAELRDMALRILKVHRVAYGAGQGAIAERDASAIVDLISEARFRVAKPRLLARVVVDFLERQRSEADSGGVDLSVLVNEAGASLVKQASA